MIVTDISRQKRSSDRLNIFLDGEFAFGVHEEVLARIGIQRGDDIDRTTINAMMAEEEFNLAKLKALRLISHRKRSEKELREKLIEKEFDPHVLDRLISHLCSLGVLNDKDFARSFVHDARMKKASGSRLLDRQLRAKGISPTIIHDVFTEVLTKESEQTAALEAARKVVRRYQSSRKNIDQEKQRQRLAQFLTRRGFDWTTISPVLKELFPHKPSSARVI